jgi:hypothetical protein
MTTIRELLAGSRKRAAVVLRLVDQGKIEISDPERIALTRIARSAATIDNRYLGRFDARLAALDDDLDADSLGGAADLQLANSGAT